MKIILVSVKEKYQAIFNMCDGIPKPKMRGLLAAQISRHVTIAVALSIIQGLAYKFFVIDKRKRQVREYYL